MTKSPPPALLATVVELVLLIEASADESERRRRLAMPVVEAMSQPGLFRLWVPQALVGAEADIQGTSRLCLGSTAPLVGV